MKKKNLLWISPYAPYDQVAHGGGKTHNFYIKYFQQSGLFNITLLSLCMYDEIHKLDLDRYQIENHIFVMDKSKLQKLHRRSVSGLAYKNPYDPYGGVCLPYERSHMKGLIKRYRESGEKPELIFLQWTFSLMMIDYIKEVFPNAQIVAIEEDVTFLNYLRKASNENGSTQKFWNKRYQIMHDIEMEKLETAGLVVTNNLKDTSLLIKNGLNAEKIFTAAPYIDDYSEITRENVKNDIIFYGAMSRPENYESAVWFIRNVFQKLDKCFRFIIIGSNPHPVLYKYTSDRVIVTGYIDDVSDWFQTCLCMAAPLVGGAGIKIKVLEAMSAGVPVLTNEIGIEGIGATDKKEFLYCDKPEEYVGAINLLVAKKHEVNVIGQNAKKFVKENYNLPNKLDLLIKCIQEAI